MSRKQKQLLLVLYDLFVFLFAYTISYKFLEPLVVMTLRETILNALINFTVYFVIALVLHLYRKIVRYISIKDTLYQSFAIFSSYILSLIIFVFTDNTISFRYLFLAGIISLGLILTSRIVWRILIEHYWKRKRIFLYGDSEKPPVRTLVVGAGEGGAIFIKRLMEDPTIKFVGIVDDALSKQHTYVHSVEVIGQSRDLPEIIDQYNVEQVTIAIPSLKPEALNKLIDSISDKNVKINQMPSIENLLTGKYTINKFKEIDVVDLLGRDEVKLDMDIISAKTTDNVILVSGAGGSIGSEICRQLMNFKPKKLLLLGHGEFSIYNIHRELQQLRVDDIELIPVIADIQDRDRIDEVMATHKPDRVYHAAAHKHVPLMEVNPREAVKNNIYGTKNLAESAKAHGVRSFVMISTDKAVNPPNVMGSTKRIAEMIVTGLNEPGKTKFVAVRFGNVLNSCGSVIPVFKEQLKKGGPLTVTDFRMTRYFMTIPEASRLVLQAGSLAEGGEIFVLDMGEPVKIVDLAKKIIQLSGYSIDDIGIQEIGIRPGEKLYEELLTAGEFVEEQVYDKIFVGNVTDRPVNEVMNFVENLQELNEEQLATQLVEFANERYY